jgi:hypothetical protein
MTSREGMKIKSGILESQFRGDLKGASANCLQDRGRETIPQVIYSVERKLGRSRVQLPVTETSHAT